jgi:hypothetical protein
MFESTDRMIVLTRFPGQGPENEIKNEFTEVLINNI